MEAWQCRWRWQRGHILGNKAGIRGNGSEALRACERGRGGISSIGVAAQSLSAEQSSALDQQRKQLRAYALPSPGRMDRHIGVSNSIAGCLEERAVAGNRFLTAVS